MNVRTLVCGFVLGAAAALVTTSALSQDHGKGGAGGAGNQPQLPSPQDMQKMMELWMKAMTPGPQHKAMAESVGTWETTTRMWMEGPQGPPTETKGTCERKSVLGGRFITEIMKSDMMMPDMKTGEMKSVPWEGMGMFGYDNNRNMYVGCWADTMNTHLLTMKGTASPDGRTVTYYGEMDEPSLGVYGRLVKYQTQVKSADEQLFAIYDLAAGDNYKVLEVTYKRKK
jgi:hypothetical protein